MLGWEALEEATKCLKSVAHPVRLRMLELLTDGEFSVGELGGSLRRRTGLRLRPSGAAQGPRPPHTGPPREAGLLSDFGPCSRRNRSLHALELRPGCRSVGPQVWELIKKNKADTTMSHHANPPSGEARDTNRAPGWKAIAFIVAAAIVVPIYAVLSGGDEVLDDPWAFVAEAPPHTDHSSLMPGPYETGEDVTRACLDCHEAEGHEVLQTAHWNWEGEPAELPGRPEPVSMGKKNVINNFCISVQSNWSGCTSCHVGYGWVDDTFDFGNPEKVDCLVCHDQSAQYAKTLGGSLVRKWTWLRQLRV